MVVGCFSVGEHFDFIMNIMLKARHVQIKSFDRKLCCRFLMSRFSENGVKMLCVCVCVVGGVGG